METLFFERMKMSLLPFVFHRTSTIDAFDCNNSQFKSMNGNIAGDAAAIEFLYKYYTI